MTQLVALQFILPVAIIAWLAFGPTRSRLGLLATISALVAVLTALHLSGMWLMPPWWTIWAYWALVGPAAWLAAAAAILVYFATRNVFATIVGGVLAMFLLHRFAGL